MMKKRKAQAHILVDHFPMGYAIDIVSKGGRSWRIDELYPHIVDVRSDARSLGHVLGIPVVETKECRITGLSVKVEE